MSSNQKPVPQAPPQQQRCYQQAPYGYQFQNPSKHVKIGADGGFHVSSPAANYGPQQGPPQQQSLAMRPSGMPPTVPPNQSSTPPQQTDGMKVSQMQTQGGNMPMTFLQQAAGVRGAPPNAYYRPQMTAPNRTSHHRQTQHMYHQQMPIFTPMTQPVLLPNQMGYAQYNQPRPQGGYVMYPPISSTQSIYNYNSNQPSQQYFFPQAVGQAAPPMSIIPRAGPQAPAPTGPQGPNHPAAVSMPLPQQTHTMQPPTVSKKTIRKHAIRIIDPSTGEDKSNEIYGADDFPPPDSGDSSARETPQPDVQMDVPTEYTNKITMQRSDVIISDPEHRTDVPLAEGLVHLEEILQTDGGLNTKIVKKIEILPPSESKLQAGTKEFIPVESMKSLPPAPARETPVVSASAGIEVIVCNKSSKERESPAKSRKARENAQRISNEVNIQRDLNLVQSVPALLENETTREIPLQLANASLSQPILIDNKQIPLDIMYQIDAQASSAAPRDVILKEHVQIPLPHLQMPPPIIQQVPIHPPPQINIPPPQTQPAPIMTHPKDLHSNKDVAVHHSDTTLTSKGKQANKAKVAAEPKFDTKNPVQNNTFGSPQVENSHGNKNKATENKKPVSSKDTPKQNPPSATTSAPTVQKQPPPAAPALTPAPTTTPAVGPTPPIPVSQPPKASNKTSKMRELNRKGADKEGTDMDAFSTNDNLANSELSVNNNSIAPAKPNSDNKVNQPAITPNVKAGVELNTASSKPETKSLPISKPKGGDVCSIVNDMPRPAPFRPPVSQGSNKDAANKISNDAEKLVQAKNEANAKANSINNNNSPPIEPIQSASSSLTKLPYKDEQWSPWNQNGKKVYDREFLVALRGVSNSIIKPNYIPQEIEVEKDSKHPRSVDANRYASNMSRQDNLFPLYAKSASHRGAPVPNRKSLQGKPGGKPGGKPNVIHVSLSLREDVKLNETENAWKPARLAKSGEVANEEQVKTAALYKKVRGILNKLTPQKFNTLVNQVRDLKIDNTERLQGVIDLVFEKAVDEPNYALAYAYMCREVALMQVPAKPKEDGKEVEYVNFRKLLITRCQQEFENNDGDDTVRNKKVKEIEECTDPEKKKELELLLEDEDRRERLKSVGNVKFIGELFKQQMLTANIMCRCLSKLVETLEEESLECLCKLLITTGKDLEVEKKVVIAPFFVKMQDIVDTKRDKISSRVRFMLQDVIELRNNKWVPRRQDNNPTTIDQIQKDAENEQLAIQINNSQPPTPRRDDRMGGGNAGGDRGKRSRNQTNEEGWCNVPTQARNRTFVVESHKLKSTKPTTIDNERLGPPQSFFKWNQGANAVLPQASYSNNKFSALSEQAPSDNDRRFNKGARNGNKEPYSSKGPSMERSYNKYDDRGSRSGSQARSRDGSQARQQMPPSIPIQPPVNLPMAPPKPVSAPPPADVKTPEDIDAATMSILNDYIGDKNVVWSGDELRRKFPEKDMGKFVYSCFIGILEKNSNTRALTGKFIALLCKQQFLNLSAVCEGLREVFDVIDDFIIDIPKVWEYVSELIAPLLAEGVLSLKVLKQTMFETACINVDSKDENYPGDSPGKLLINIINLLKKDKEPSFVRNLWVESNLTVADFVPNKKINSFINDNQLEFLSGSSASVVPSTKGAIQESEVTNKLVEFLVKNTEFNDITEWVTANVGVGAADNKTFIRSLVTAICTYSIKDLKLDSTAFEKYVRLIHRYVDCKPEREVQVLYALQAYVNKLAHPAGLLLSICNKLLDATISAEGFLQWAKCKDPAELTGKGVALKSLHSFITALEEAETDSSSEGESDHGGK